MGAHDLRAPGEGRGDHPLTFVGTSGWTYDWNPDGLDWYVKNSGLNAVELNASFYRFPFQNMVKSWARKGRPLRWAIKVHRSVTHVHRLNVKSYEVMERFLRLFEPMKDLIDFYLVQLPPSFARNAENERRVRRFAERFDVPLAFEFRHESWFDEKTVEALEPLSNAFVVSVDSPMGTWIVESKGTVYIRFHGRTDWYFHNYTEDELREVAEKTLSLEPKRIYAFFNNDHWMLENARRFKELLDELSGRRPRPP